MEKCRLMVLIMSVAALCVAAHDVSSSEPLLHRLRTYTHVWPDMAFGWRIIVGTIFGFIGASSGSIGGVGGGGIFVPMLRLVIGFDTKSATAVSSCMVMATSAATSINNLRNQEEHLIDYDLAVLIQPLLVLGISIGVTFNVIFPQWIITILLIILVIVTTNKAFWTGIDLWNNEEASIRRRKEETLLNERNQHEASTSNSSVSEEGRVDVIPKPTSRVPILANVHWTQVGVLVLVWVAILAIQIVKNNTTTCSASYWVIDLLQIPVAVGASGYQAWVLYRGNRVGQPNWEARKISQCCGGALFAGTAGGLLGLGGGLILSPLLLGLGINPRVSSATSMFAIMFSTSMSVVEYYILKRFPIPYALYFFGVAILGTLVGQIVIGRLVRNRDSYLVFVLAFTLLVSLILLGYEGIADIVEKIEEAAYMGFESLCSS